MTHLSRITLSLAAEDSASPCTHRLWRRMEALQRDRLAAADVQTGLFAFSTRRKRLFQ